MQLSGDMEADFLQEGTFWWLTGIEEPGWRLVVDSAGGGHAVLFRPERDETRTIFDGATTDDDIRAVSGIEKIKSAGEFEHELRQWRRRHPLVKSLKPVEHGKFVHNPALHDTAKLLDRIFEKTEDCTRTIYELRAIKQPEEIRRIREAVKLTIKTFAAYRDQLADLKSEYGIEAFFTSAFRSSNAHHAYHPIVAAGERACTLHYGKNNQTFMKKHGILIDIGARYQGYSADITRTYCLAPTKRFTEVHAAVERAHHRCIGLLKPDLPVNDYIAAVDEIMKDALFEVGLLSDRNDQQTYRKYFPHAISHGLGADTHDPLGSPRYFRPGMVLTVEPGIYIPEEGIGMRIEDDILITEDGHENLSAALSTKL